MATDRRVDRLQSFILREVSAIFRKGMNDPRIGELIISRVKLSKDLRYCTVAVVLKGSDTEKRTTFRGLESATSAIQYRMASSLALRNVPILKFEIDNHPEKAIEMDEIFNKIASDRDEKEPEEDIEDLS